MWVEGVGNGRGVGEFGGLGSGLQMRGRSLTKVVGGVAGGWGGCFRKTDKGRGLSIARWRARECKA